MKSPNRVRGNISIEGKNLISKVNGRFFQFDTLEIPTLAALIKQVPSIAAF